MSVFCGRCDLRNEDGGAAERGQFLAEREEEITNQLLRLNFVTQRGYRINDQPRHTNGVHDVDDGLDESVDIIQIKRRFFQAQPRIEDVHVEDVDEA